MSERILITIHSGEASLVAEVFRLADEYAKERGLSAAVRISERGYEVLAVLPAKVPEVKK